VYRSVPFRSWDSCGDRPPRRGLAGFCGARCWLQEPARGNRHHNPYGRLVFHVFAALAEFIRELIVGAREGVDAARARGTRLGRPPAMTAEQIRHAHHLLIRPGNTASSIARLLGVSLGTIYKYIPELHRQARSHHPSSWTGVVGVPVTMTRQHRHGVQFPERPWCALWHGWPSARPERVIGVAGPSADLAALVWLCLLCVPGSLQLGCREAGSRLRVQKPGTPGSARPAARRRSACRSGSTVAVVRVLDPPGPGELIDADGDTVQDRRHPGQVDHHQRPLKVIAAREGWPRKFFGATN
jgi:hypothetical protein